MNNKEIRTVIADYMESIKDNTKKSLDFIEETVSYLTFLKNYLKLKPHEKIACDSALSGGNLTEGQIKKLNSFKKEKDRDNYIESLARANYFKRLAWLRFLHNEKENGKDCEKPYVEKSKED